MATPRAGPALTSRHALRMKRRMTETSLWIVAALAALLLIVAFIWRGAAKRTEQEAARRPAPEARPAKEAPARSAEAPAPVPPPASAPAGASPFLPAPDGPRDNLRQIKGIGPKLAGKLEELGVFHFRQIASWTPEQMAAVDEKLGNFAGRPARDQWQEQARLLAAGDIKAYEKQHGKLS